MRRVISDGYRRICRQEEVNKLGPSPIRSKALFNLADLYVFPSRHESYGLTLLEALREGKPVLCTPTSGAREVFQESFGVMIPPVPESSFPAHLLEGLKRLLSPSQLEAMGKAAAAWSQTQRFSATAARLAKLLSAAKV